MNNGKDINEILEMPIHYVVQLIQDKNKPKEETSLIAAFGG
ncbi:phage tail assembly chaperone GT [Paraliobacillus ryukyuensis]